MAVRSCGPKTLGTAHLVVAPVTLVTRVVLLEVFIQYLFLSPTISIYNVGSWQVDLKHTFKRRIGREETPINVKSTQTMTGI